MFIENVGQITQSDIRTNTTLNMKVTDFIRENFTISDKVVTTKKNKIKKLKEKMLNPKAFDIEYIKVYLALQQRKAFQATFSNPQFMTKFSGFEIGDDVRAWKMQKLAEFDYRAMDKKNKDIMRAGHLFDYGTALEIPTGYDPIKMTTKYSVVNPEFRYPQPISDTANQSYEYHFFEMFMSESSMKEMNESYKRDVYFDTDKLQLDNKESVSRMSKRGYNTNTAVKGQHLLVQGYIRINGYRYSFTIGNAQTQIVRREPCGTVYKYEKENPYLIPDPVVQYVIQPMDDDYMGVAPLELIIDKQNTVNRLMNMAVKKEEQNVFNKFIFDVDLIDDPELLGIDTDEANIYIPSAVNTTKPLQNAVVPIYDKNGLDQGKLTLSDIVTQMGKEQTGFTNQNLGIGAEGATLGQSKIVQQNSNLLFSLDATLISIGERRFWKDVWLRDYHKYFKKTQKKSFRVGSGLLGRNIEFDVNDMLAGEHADVDIIPMKQWMEWRNDRVNFLNVEQVLQAQNPDVPSIAKIRIAREKVYLQMDDMAEALRMYPYTKDELEANALKELIDQDIDPGSIFKQGIDLDTLLVILSDCKESKLRTKTLEEIVALKSKQGQETNSVQGDQSKLNSVFNQNIAKNISQENKKEEVSLDPNV